MLKALNVAHYFLKELSQPAKDGDIISNLKLQKLLYYSQGIHLAIHDKALFSDEIYKWKLGPVVKTVYDHYRKYGSNALPVPKKKIDLSKFSNNDINTIHRTYNTYGQYSAWVLSKMTHKESPWIKTKEKDIITKDSLKGFFKPRIDSDNIWSIAHV